MKRLRLFTCAVCMAAAMISLACAWIQANPPVFPDEYTSVHASATMAPLVGFAADSLVNTGDAERLDTLPGVGEVIAQRIIEIREMLGGYRLPEDLLLVKGIGEKTLNKIMESMEEPLLRLQELTD